MDPAEVVRAGQADETLARHEAAIDTVQEAQAELAERAHHSLPERLLRRRTLERGRREPHPAQRWLEAARRYSAPELRGRDIGRRPAHRGGRRELETLVKRKRQIVNDEHAEPLTEAETATWERLLGKAAGDEDLFGRKRRDAAAKGKLDELIDARKVAKLPRQPLLAEPGSVQLPRFVYSWLVGDEARGGAWTLMDIGVLVAVLGAFANDDPSVFVGGRFEGAGGDRTLVVPGGIGADPRLYGKITGSPLEEGSGYVRDPGGFAHSHHQQVGRHQADCRRVADPARRKGTKLDGGHLGRHYLRVVIHAYGSLACAGVERPGSNAGPLRIRGGWELAREDAEGADPRSVRRTPLDRDVVLGTAQHERNLVAGTDRDR